MKETKTRQKGITLIALIVTIIVLIILAGIAISMLTGDNSILSNATEARDKTLEAQVHENIMLAYNAALIDKMKNYKTDEQLLEQFDTELEKVYGAGKVTITSNENGYTITIDGVGTYRADSNGKITTTGTQSGGSGGGNPPVAFVSKLSATEKTALTTNGIAEITESSSLKNDTKVKAVLTGNVVIPTGFYYLGGTLDSGVVISDNANDNINNENVTGYEKGNQFVWVPVSELFYDGTNADKKPMARVSTATGYTGTAENPNYEGVLYDNNLALRTDNSTNIQGQGGYREPDIVSSFDDGTTSGRTEITNTNLQKAYNEMIDSVKTYGGFYIGRYEMGESSAVISKAGETPVSNKTWYQLYALAKTYTKEGIQAEMVWGSQWDAMLNWAYATGTEENENQTRVTANTYGNHTSSNEKMGNGTYNKEGVYDVINNIYDLEGNVSEWTQEAFNANVRVVRGGDFNFSFSTAFHDNYFGYPTNTGRGSRLTLYIK